MPKWVLPVIIGLLVVFLSAFSTLYLVYFDPKAKTADVNAPIPRRFDVFDNYTTCEKAVRDAVEGEVVSIESDDRAARYDVKENMNYLYYNIQYKPGGGFMRKASDKVTELFGRCDVSAESNDIVAIRMREFDKEEFSIVRRKH